MQLRTHTATFRASSLPLDGLEVDGGHGVDQLHGQGIHQTASSLIPTGPLQKQTLDPHTILEKKAFLVFVVVYFFCACVCVMTALRDHSPSANLMFGIHEMRLPLLSRILEEFSQGVAKL